MDPIVNLFLLLSVMCLLYASLGVLAVGLEHMPSLLDGRQRRMRRLPATRRPLQRGRVRRRRNSRLLPADSGRPPSSGAVQRRRPS